jgi:DNA-binding NtrC family response regulator
MSCQTQQAEVQRVVVGSEWSILPVRTLHEAMCALAQWKLPLVLCEPRFPGGDWRDLLSHLNSQKGAPKLVLVAPHDTTLAAELMNLGGYDVLEKPLDRAECLHVFASARRNWHGPVHSHAGWASQDFRRHRFSPMLGVWYQPAADVAYSEDAGYVG